jgi:Zn-dependent protease
MMSLIVSLFLFFFALTVHEFAHGWVAWRLGDPTAKEAGRLTLNPFAHIDPVGTVILPILLAIANFPVFGWARPVPVDFYNLNNPKKDMIWVGLAGPLANIVFAILVSQALKISAIAVNPFFSTVLNSVIIINIVLAVFNILPIPPLDGSRVMMGILPRKLAIRYVRLEPYGFIIIIAMLYLKVMERLIWPIVIYLSHMLGATL